MITPGDGIHDYEPLNELDSQLDSYDDPIQFSLTKNDAAYYAMGVARKAKYRLTESFNAVRERYPDTYFGLPINNEYDESWLYGDDHQGNHRDCWCEDWTFRFDGEQNHFGDLAPTEYVLALKTGSEVGKYGRTPVGDSYFLVFEFQYAANYHNQINSPFDNIEFQYNGPLTEYNEVMESLTETYGGGGSYRRGPMTDTHWTQFEPFENV